MTVRRRRLAAGAASLALVSCCLLGGQSPAVAENSTPRTYVGPPFSTDVLTTPTGTESQSKLWFHDNTWWGLLNGPRGRGVRVQELMPDHSWQAADAVLSTNVQQVGDALPDGDTVHVTQRIPNGDLQYVRLTYDPESREYRASDPVTVTTLGGNGFASIVKDGEGRLWVGYANGLVTAVTWSDDGGASWAEMHDLARTSGDAPAEVADLVAYDDRVGILWSDQATNSFRFASHADGDDPTAWARETALSGAAVADNHIDLVRIPGESSDTLAAAVKTSTNDVTTDPDEVLIKVLVRSPGGDWSDVPAATIGDGLNQPILQVDLATETLHLFASTSAGDIATKTSPLDDIGFEPGRGELFMVGADGRLLDPTGTNQFLDARSGLVILASDMLRMVYRHAEQSLGTLPPVAGAKDTTAPSKPVGLRGRAIDPETLVLSWGPAHDGEQWIPAGNGVPVASYVISRDGERIAEVTSTTFRDTPREGPATTATTVRYEVRAVDAAGNRSRAVPVDVELPAPEGSVPMIVGLVTLLLAAAGAAYWALRRRRLDRSLASGPTLDVEPEPAPRGSLVHSAR
jgi:hypothetical protein